MRVIQAETAGFCSGVKRAVYGILEAADRHGGGSTLGALVHNDEVLHYLRQRSVKAVSDPAEADGAFLAVRTHGVAAGQFRALEKLQDLKILDMTCPRVQRVQRIVSRLGESGTKVIIFGDPSHPEVRGLVGWAGGQTAVVSSPGEIEGLDEGVLSALVAQTTADPGSYAEAKEVFRRMFPAGQVFETLCPETGLKREEVFKLSQRVEALVVVGSEASANTKALYEYCRQLRPSCRVNNARELDRSFLERFRVFGVTAGASTPPWTIKEVVERMENENQEVKQEEQFDFSGEVKVAQVGEQVTGKVARVAEDEVFVDIGAKMEAVLPAEEVHLGEGQQLSDLFSPEDDLEVTVLETDEQEGRVIVSHKRLAREKRLQELEQLLADDTVAAGRVRQVLPAGIVVDLGAGIEGFMPGSLVDTRYIPDFKEFMEQQVQFKILEFDREKGKLILSRKKVLEEEESLKKEETLKELKIGSTITGTVKRLTNFGAFVDVGGIDGLVHISELAWERVAHPGEVLKTGQEVEVKVLEVIPEKERISLSIRKTLPDPWTRAVEDLESGQLITGRVTRLVNFGAFIEIKPGVEGLAHISQLAEYHVKHPSEILREGEEVEVKVLEVKPKAKRISLSLKEARGVLILTGKENGEGAENGNVTLGDIFGDLFENEQFAPAEAGSEEEGGPGDRQEESVVVDSGEEQGLPPGVAEEPAVEAVTPEQDGVGEELKEEISDAGPAAAAESGEPAGEAGIKTKEEREEGDPV